MKSTSAIGERKVLEHEHEMVLLSALAMCIAPRALLKLNHQTAPFALVELFLLQFGEIKVRRTFSHTSIVSDFGVGGGRDGGSYVIQWKKVDVHSLQ